MTRQLSGIHAEADSLLEKKKIHYYLIMINVWQRCQLSCEVATFFFDFNQEEEEEEWWSEKDRRAVKDEDVISGHVKHRGREQIGRPSGLMHQTQLSIICGFHYHGNTSMKGHLGASRFPTAFLQKQHPQRGMIFHVNVGNALPISELITDKVLTFGKLSAWRWRNPGTIFSDLLVAE